MIPTGSFSKWTFDAKTASYRPIILALYITTIQQCAVAVIMASHYLAEQIHQHFLQCGICLDPFQNPKALPCLHAFCEECLERWYRTNKKKNPGVMICPNCKKSAQVPSGGIQGFPAHFMVNSLQETVDNMEKVRQHVVT